MRKLVLLLWILLFLTPMLAGCFYPYYRDDWYDRGYRYDRRYYEDRRYDDYRDGNRDYNRDYNGDRYYRDRR
jgi:hypothetical protein